MSDTKPSDIRKYIVQFFGVCLGIGGMCLIYTGVQIQGNTTIRFSFSDIDSELQTGQIAIVLIFLGFLLVFIPAISIPPLKVPVMFNNKVMTFVFAALLLFGAMAGIIALLYHLKADGLLIAGFFVAMFLISMGVLIAIGEGYGDKSDER